MSRIEELEKRLAADPNSRMFVQLAEEYRKAGLLEQAIDVCEQGLKKHPQYPSARVALGRALLEAGTLDRAGAEFEAVLKQVPDNILANKFLGETYHRLGRHDEALKKYRVAHTLAPEDTDLDEKIAEVQAALAGPGASPAVAAATPQVEAPPAQPATAAPSPPDAAEPEPVPEAHSRDEDSLPPIPLVEVDEPMILEERNYVPPAPSRPADAPQPAPGSRTQPSSATPAAAPRSSQPEAPPKARVHQKAPSPAVAEIDTPTMAEIYASQGHLDRAIAVYQRIVERHPGDPQHRERLEELQILQAAASVPRRREQPRPAHPSPPAPAAAAAPASGDAHRRTIRVLEEWLAAIQKSRGA